MIWRDLSWRDIPWSCTLDTYLADLSRPVWSCLLCGPPSMTWVSPKKANLGPKMAEHDRLFNVPMWFKKVQNGQPNYETKKNVRKRSKFYQNRTFYPSFLAINGNLWIRKNLSTHIWCQRWSGKSFMKIGCSEVPKPTYPSLLWLAEWKVPAPFMFMFIVHVPV